MPGMYLAWCSNNMIFKIYIIKESENQTQINRDLLNIIEREIIISAPIINPYNRKMIPWGFKRIAM